MQTDLIKTIIYFLTGGFLVFQAITVTRDNFSNRVNRTAGAMLLFAGLGPLSLALGYLIFDTPGATPSVAVDGTTMYNLYHVWEFFFPALLVFSWVFPIDRLRTIRLPYLRYIIVIPQLLHVLLALFHKQMLVALNAIVESGGGEGFTALVLRPVAWLSSQLIQFVGLVYQNEQVIFGAINILYILVAVYFLESGRRYLTNPRLLSQARIVIWGTRLGMGLFIVSFLCTTLSASELVQSAGSYLLLAAILTGSGCFAYAIIRHQFLGVQLVFRQSLIYTITSALLVGTYVVVGMSSEQFLEPLFGSRAEAVSYVFILFILLLFQPISSWIDNVITSMFVRTRTDHRNIIERFSRQIISMFDPLQLRQSIEEMLKTALLVERVYFVLYDDSVKEYAILRSDDYPRRTVIAREDLTLRGINLLDTPTRFTSLSDFAEGSRLAEILQELGVRIILPMKDSEHLLGFLALTSKAAGYRYTAEDFNLLGVLSNQMVGALTNARLYAVSLENARLQEEVNMARQIQLDLLPSSPPQLAVAHISALSTPSRTVGGDYYDFIEIDNDHRVGMVIGDASGKGLPAALLIAQIQAMMRSEINNGNPIPKMMANVNTQVALTTSSEKYVTLFYGELDTTTCEFKYANAGHNYPVLVRADGTVELLQAGGPIIGAFPRMEYSAATVKLDPDDLLFLFTDGLSEAMDTNNCEYTEERIRRWLVDHRNDDSDAIMKGILDDVYRFDPTTPPQDDTTVVAVKMKGGPLLRE